MKIEFTKEEAQANLALIDLAVKSAGLQVAGAANALAEKLATALKDNENGKGASDAVLNDNQ